MFATLFDPPFIKIPSALITNEAILKEAKSTKVPLILSTGMCNFGIIDKAIETVGKENIYCLMHCTSTYPSKPNEINAKCVLKLKERYPGMKIGFSNHYPGLSAMTLAYAYGAEMIEFHGTLDRASYGSDQAASIEPNGVFELMSRLRLYEQMIGDGEKVIYESEIPILKKLRR